MSDICVVECDWVHSSPQRADECEHQQNHLVLMPAVGTKHSGEEADVSDEQPSLAHRAYHALCICSGVSLLLCVFVGVVLPWWNGTAAVVVFPTSSMLEATPSYLMKTALVLGSSLVVTVSCALALCISSIVAVFETHSPFALGPLCVALRVCVLLLSTLVVESIFVDSCEANSMYKGVLPLSALSPFVPTRNYQIEDAFPSSMCESVTTVSLLFVTECIALLEAGVSLCVFASAFFCGLCASRCSGGHRQDAVEKSKALDV